MRPRLTLASQLLGFQGLIVLIVILVVTPVTIVQDDRAFQRTETRRVLATAENMAGSLVIQQGLADGSFNGVPGEAERMRSASGIDYVVVLDAAGEVVYDSDPDLADDLAVGPGSRVGVVDHGEDDAVQAGVPVEAVTSTGTFRVGDVAGHVIAGRIYPSPLEQLGSALPSLLIYLLIGSAIGLGGSLLLSRRIKRQTLGLEPIEIRGLVEHREALLHGLREGVVGVGTHGRITLVNDEAKRLLQLHDSQVDDPVDELPLSPMLRKVLRGEAPARDLAAPIGRNILVLNQMPVRHERQLIGWVTTVRDRTELMELNRELNLWRSTTDTLRAQTHEYTNWLHTIAGLIEMGDFNEVRSFVVQQARAHEDWLEHVLRLIHDPAVAALLVAKGSRAAELGVTLSLEETSTLPSLSDELTPPTLTVLGNLIDNAMDAVSPINGDVEVHIVADSVELQITVTDNGPGVPPEHRETIFDTGFSTKSSAEPAGRGWGLALARLTTERLDGELSYSRVEAETETYTVFSATLPLKQESPA